MSKLNTNNPYKSFIVGVSETDRKNYVAKTEQIVNWRTGEESYRTVYVPTSEVNKSLGSPIPPRQTQSGLDLSKIAEAKAHADKIRNELKGK